MKTMKKIFAVCMALVLALSCVPTVFAADVANATIDETAKGSLTVYKIDLTNAEKDGVWDSSYVSTGVYDQSVYDTLIGANRAGGYRQFQRPGQWRNQFWLCREGGRVYLPSGRGYRAVF